MKLLRYAGFLTWGLAGLPLLVRLGQEPVLSRDPRYLLWLVCFFVFGVAFGLTGWREPTSHPGRRQLASLTLQTVATLAMIQLVCSGQEGALLVIVAAQLGWVLPLTPALVWVAVQAMVMCTILALYWCGSATITLTVMTRYLGFQVLALFSCFLTAREATARSKLTQTNSELHATRELLANTSRLAERERISRELHDTLGHHLTALSLNLEAASHMANGQTLTQVRRAQVVTKQLLTDVRGAVSALRGEDSISLTEALRMLVDAVPQPRVHLSLPDDLAIGDPLCAQTVLRCVQEIVTNAIRHAHAANVWIELAQCDGRLQLLARDDGHGVQQVRPGHGLIGMRERVEFVGGHLEVRSAPAQGFQVNASIPLHGGVT